MAINSLPASTSLVEEINQLAPDRDRRSDGTIGDTAHQQAPSDHNPDETGNTGGVEDSDAVNEVHARDVDASGPWPAGWSMERVVQIILARCRSGAEKRLRYIIYARRIWSASSGWAQKTYTGVNPHTLHAHFSFRYGSGSGTTNPENITAPWGLLAARRADEEADMPTADEIATAVVKKIRASYPVLSDSDRKATAAAVWAHTEPNPYDDGKTTRRVGGDLRLMEFRADERQRQVIGLFTALATAVGADTLDEDEIATAVLAGLTPERLAAAITAAGLTPEALAAAIPENLASEVLDELHDRTAPQL